MKRTHIAAILIAITANNASAQQTVSVPYQAGQSWPASQVYQSPVQQSNSQPSSHRGQSAPYMTQGQYYAVPQTVGQSTDSTAKTQPQQSQVAAASRAPAPAPSIPPQPGDFILPPPTSVVAQPVQQVEASILETQKLAVTDQAETLSGLALPQPEENIPSPTTPSLVAQPEPVKPEGGILKTQEIQEEFATVENNQLIVEPVKKATAPLETTNAVVENQLDIEPAIAGTSGDLNGELVVTSETSSETSPAVSSVENSIAPAADTDFANIVPAQEFGEDATEPSGLVMNETIVSEETKIESIELRSPNSSSLEANSVEPAVIATAPLNTAKEVLVAKEASPVVPLRSNSQKTNSPVTRTSTKKLQRSYWPLALLPLLGIPFVGWLALQKRKRNAEVNSFANEALSRVNSKPLAEESSQREKLKKSGAGSPSPVRSRLNELVKGVDQEKTAAATRTTAAAAPAERKEASTSKDDFANCDQFCCIRGIDSATQQKLHKAGYVRFGDLEKATQSDLELALSGTDHQFSSSDFSRWSSLSGLASKGDWDGFEKLQASFTSPKVSKVRSEQPSGPDDLTKVRGIGPATAELLNEAGITTFKTLTEAGTERLQEILTAGGDKFSAIDPSLWCKQAQFQLSGTWNRTHAETTILEPESSAESESIAPNVTVTTPKYRTPEPTLDTCTLGSDQTSTSSVTDRLAKMTGVVGALSKDQADQPEQLAGTTPSQPNDESSLLDQINAICDIASSSAEGKVSEKAVSAADDAKASAE